MQLLENIFGGNTWFTVLPPKPPTFVQGRGQLRSFRASNPKTESHLLRLLPRSKNIHSFKNDKALAPRQECLASPCPVAFVGSGRVLLFLFPKLLRFPNPGEASACAWGMAFSVARESYEFSFVSLGFQTCIKSCNCRRARLCFTSQLWFLWSLNLWDT